MPAPRRFMSSLPSQGNTRRGRGRRSGRGGDVGRNCRCWRSRSMSKSVRTHLAVGAPRRRDAHHCVRDRAHGRHAHPRAPRAARGRCARETVGGSSGGVGAGRRSARTIGEQAGTRASRGGGVRGEAGGPSCDGVGGAGQERSRGRSGRGGQCGGVGDDAAGPSSGSKSLPRRREGPTLDGVRKGNPVPRRQEARCNPVQARAQERAQAHSRARAQERARPEAEIESARQLHVIPWLRQLGFSAGEARRGAVLCAHMPDAPLEKRVRVALQGLAPILRAPFRERGVRPAMMGPGGWRVPPGGPCPFRKSQLQINGPFEPPSGIERCLLGNHPAVVAPGRRLSSAR